MRPRFPKAYADLVMRLRVPSGFLLAFVFGMFARPTPQSLLLSLPLCLGGLALRGWAAGLLRKNMQLTHGGPYAYTRNPLYLGTLLTALGLSVAAQSWLLLGVTVAVFVGVYLPVMEQEEAHLVKIFPAYRNYAEKVPLLWPRFPGLASEQRFDLAQYVRNQEWKAAFAYALGMAYLVWKMSA